MRKPCSHFPVRLLRVLAIPFDSSFNHPLYLSLFPVKFEGYARRGSYWR
jgi:hypothetical protein